VANLLDIDGLRTHIRMRHSTVEAVDGISLTVGQGETVGIVGESGCGKSLTALSVMRLLPPGGSIVGGSIKLAGRELTTLSESEMCQVRGNEVGMVFQDPMTSLDPTMTIGEQIAEPVRTHRKVSRRAAIDRAAEVLSLVGMPKPRERLQAYPHQLSGGLRQRVMIAMALACEPKLIIADEPTTALDVTIQAQILALLDELKERLGMGMLLITHDLGVIAGRASRVMVMYAGRIVESTDAATLFGDMRHPYTEALLESIPDVRSGREGVLYSIPGLPPDLSRAPACCRFSPRCRYAEERCFDEDPGLEGAAPGHSYACFFPVRHLAKPEIPAQPAAEDSATAEEPEAATAAPGPAALAVKARSTPAAHDPVADPLLVIDHVVKEFPITKGILQRRIGSVKALSDVSLQIGRGEIFGLVGESGCGKTTLGRLVTALDVPDSGSIVFDGTDLTALRGAALRRRRREFQLMFQDPYASLDPRMRVMSILREPLAAHRIGTRAQQHARIERLLAEVGLPGRSLGLYPHEFSGGQRQRVGLARALTVGPRLVVADEPVSALDVSIRAQVLNLMKRLRGEHDLTYIVISHDLSVVRYLADRVGVMYLGKLVEVGPSGQVYEGPAHPYTAGLLQAIPVPDPASTLGKHPAVEGELPSAANPPSGCRFRTRCPRSQDICAQVEPGMRSFGNPGHMAACHFPLIDPPKAAMDTAARAGPPAAETSSLPGTGGTPQPRQSKDTYEERP
jgi:peptide/nickel transport system ATP-binding protein